MLFNSLEYCIFFPVVGVLYYALAPKYRWILLLVASCAFYMAFVPKYILILFLIIAIDYVAAIQMTKTQGLAARRALLLLSIVANVGILCLFKYTNFFAANVDRLLVASGARPLDWRLSLILPIGLSFHTFQSLSYTIEVYYGTLKGKVERPYAAGVKPERHFGLYALYVLFFPQMVAGPIERPQSLLPRLREEHRFDYDRAVSALRLILLGFAKKILLADNLAFYVDRIYGHPRASSAGALLLATYFYTIQIYCDFSGYTDIARGSARFLGIELRENFNAPYLARSLADFWRRWHMSLSTWFRDYIYIPLGGSRRALPRTLANIMIVFVVSGLWHGASWTYVIWGAVHGVLLSAEILLKKAAPGLFSAATPAAVALQRIVTFSLVCGARIFSRSASLSDALYVFRTIARSGASSLFQAWRALGTAGGQALLAATLALLLGEYLVETRDLLARFRRQPKLVRWSCYYAALALIAFYGRFEERPFLYFQF